YTYENLTKVSQATARWILDENITKNGVVIGYDARFEGRSFARHAAAVFASMDIPVQIADAISPTPAVSLWTQQNKAIGIVITASHPPHQYNGFKIKASFGGPATPAQIDAVEARIPDYDASASAQSYEEYIQQGIIHEVPITHRYL